MTGPNTPTHTRLDTGVHLSRAQRVRGLTMPEIPRHCPRGCCRRGTMHQREGPGPLGEDAGAHAVAVEVGQHRVVHWAHAELLARGRHVGGELFVEASVACSPASACRGPCPSEPRGSNGSARQSEQREL
jgi:hypothetical protein